MANPQHIAWLKEGVNPWNARRQRQRFDPDLSSEDVSRALGGHEREDIREISVNLSNVNLSGADLSNSTLRDTNLTAAKFFMANLHNANLIGSDLTGAQFIGGTSRGARFTRAKFLRTLFLEHDLTAAQFNGAELQDTKFIQCTLHMAHLYNETLTGADFILSRPWSALLFWPSANANRGSQAFDNQTIGSINDLLDRCREFRKVNGDELVLYFRALRPAAATNCQQVQVRLGPSELRTGNKSKFRWSQLSYGNGNKCAAVWSIRQPEGPALMKRPPLLHRLKRRNRRCLPLKPLHLH